MSAQTLSLCTTGLRLRRGSSRQRLPHLQVTNSSSYNRYHDKRCHHLRYIFEPRSALDVFILVSTLAALFTILRTICIVLSERRSLAALPAKKSLKVTTAPVVSQESLPFLSQELSPVKNQKMHSRGWKRARLRQHEPSNHVQNPILASKHLELLPKTRWLSIKALRNFKPRFNALTDIRLVTLEDACYCTERSKFLLPSISSKKRGHFPHFMRRHGISRHVRWKSPRSLLVRSTQNVTRISGTTILWRGRGLSGHHSHLVRSLIPIRSLIDELRKTSFGNHLKLAAESFIHRVHPDPLVTKLHEYYFGDIPQNNRISIRDQKPNLLCFDRVVSLGTEFEGHSESTLSHDKIKDLVQRIDKEHLPKKLSKNCCDADANRRTVWILDRQQTHSARGSISNMAEITTAVNHALLHAGLADSLELKVIQGPSVQCPPGSNREGCLETDCANGSIECARENNPLRQIITFNNMTFLIAVSGPALEGLAYMPTSSTVVEIVPHGVHASDISAEVARGAGVKLHRMQNRRNDKLEKMLQERFGDVSESGRACWADTECREARLGVETHVDAHHLKKILHIILKDWHRSCIVKHD